MFTKRLITLGITIYIVLFSSVFSFASELSEIQFNLFSKGKKWLAGQTSVSKLSREARKKRLGLIMPAHFKTGVQKDGVVTSQAFEQSVQSDQVTAIPGTLDWRDNGGNYVTPVRDQGNCASCWAFATAGALESARLIADNLPNTDLDLAEQIFVSCSGAGDCNGGYIHYASYFIQVTGLPGEDCFQYTATNNSCGNACLNWQNSTSKIDNWLWITTNSSTVTVLKEALNTYGPLVTTMDVYADFFYYTGGIYSYSYGSYQGGHAVLLVGYDDPGQYFIIKNSWGTDWGEDGYFKIAYSEIYSSVYFGYYTIAYNATPNEPPPITVTSPNAGSGSWTAGTTKTITWTYTGSPGSYVRIELYKSGVLNRTISSYASVGSNGNGSYNWAIPSSQTQGTDYTIKVASTSNSSINDFSDTFTIVGPPPPSITVTSPNSGSGSWTAGTTKTITWTYTGSPGSYVRIELYKGGVLNRTISSYASVGSNGNGSYNWAIPSSQTQGTDYTIKVASTSNSSINDFSDTFTIN